MKTRIFLVSVVLVVPLFFPTPALAFLESPLSTFTISAESLLNIASILLSVGLSYIPGAQARWAGLEPLQKRVTMLGLIAISTIGVYVAAYFGLIDGPVGAMQLVEAFVGAVLVNQGAFLTTSTVELALRHVHARWMR